MEIPSFWAEHKVQVPRPGKRPRTLARYGWSDLSPEDARRHAEERAAAAALEEQKGRAPTRRERKVAYSGADGLPIREEVLSRHPDAGGAVVTRNHYGSRCLNVPDVLFGDIDLDDPKQAKASFKSALGCGAMAAGLILWVGSGRIRGFNMIALAVLAVVLVYLGRHAARQLRRWRKSRRPPEEALLPVRAWCEAHPAWSLAVYRTPAGYRLLAMHETLDPRGEEAAAFFEAIRCDPVYRQMCRAQNCFRARVSAKPWRIGVKERIGYGAWPVTPERLERRVVWVKDYEARAAGTAACRRVETIGSGAEAPRCRAVRELHDRLSRADEPLPLA